MNDLKTPQYQDEGTYYGQIRHAADWIADTWNSDQPGAFGFWCAVAGLDAGAVVERLELKRAS